MGWHGLVRNKFECAGSKPISKTAAQGKSLPARATGGDQEMPYFLTFQVVGWADVFTRKTYRDFILENLTYSRKEKCLYLFG